MQDESPRFQLAQQSHFVSHKFWQAGARITKQIQSIHPVHIVIGEVPKSIIPITLHAAGSVLEHAQSAQTAAAASVNVNVVGEAAGGFVTSLGCNELDFISVDAKK
jgi:hypothetical protein